MIKNIVFDLGGVLIDYNPEKTLKYFFNDQADIDLILKSVFFSDKWSDLDRGVLSIDELVKFCYQVTPEHTHKILTHLMCNFWDYMPPFPQMYPLVESLHKNGYKIYLLSNTNEKIFEYKDLIPALSFFDGIIASCDYHIIKPDEGIYKILFDKFDLNPEECFFIDDNKANTDAAEKLGMRSFCHKEKDVEKLKTALKNSGINIY